MTTIDPSKMSGLELLRFARDLPEPPPNIGTLLGMNFEELQEGRVVVSLTPRADFANPLGVVHGGIASTMLDSAMGCAVHTTLQAGTGYTTLELKVNLVQAIPVDSPKVFCEGKILHAGHRTATAEGYLTDTHGKLLAHGTTTCILFR